MRTWFRRWMWLCTWTWFCSWTWLPISRTCSYCSRSLWNTSEDPGFPRTPGVECSLLLCSYAVHTLELHAYCVACTEDTWTWKITSRTMYQSALETHTYMPVCTEQYIQSWRIYLHNCLFSYFTLDTIFFCLSIHTLALSPRWTAFFFHSSKNFFSDTEVGAQRVSRGIMQGPTVQDALV